ncbi:hypothetical protein BGZ99_007706 [Dissophora globulifera]|uniref:Dystroglycan-type cadherin-like domain-containing protein n=1 Tax=Dissophora globulifera TaxID=979702 RepID=A0A9P6RRT5_9FUNG|nr:hypothetical protein BGZ99_007706 [Dissophora globulifera]
MPVYHLITLLALVSGSSLRQGGRAFLGGFGLVQATQDSAHYFLPPNIYDNLPPGLTTPLAPVPTPPPSAVSNRIASGPDDPLTIEVTTPLLNAIFTPGSEVVMTWTNNDAVSFPEGWTAPQSVLDMITNDANFSHNPLLTQDDMINLAKIKVIDLKRAALTSALKDSPIWLQSLRLLSWPLSPSSLASDNNNDGGIDKNDSNASENYDSNHTVTESTSQQQQTVFSISPNVLSDPGYSLQNVSRMMILGTAGGQITWTIPEDWEYEGEFEVRIPSAASSLNGDGGAKSRSFWILRDVATRTNNPQYNLPSMEQQQRLATGATDRFSHERSVQRQRDMGIFLGVSAMMLAFILVGLGFMIGIYRRRWATRSASSSASPPASFDSDGYHRHHHLESSLATDSLITSSATSSLSAGQMKQPAGQQHQHERYGCNTFDYSQGDDDAHSPTDLNLSDETISEKVTAAGGTKIANMEWAQQQRVGEMSALSPVDLPLYEAEDSSSSSTLASSTTQGMSSQDLQDRPC